MSTPRESDVAMDGDPLDPYDRYRSGYTLANNQELIFGCLDAAGVESVIEVGSAYGAFTHDLLAWGGDRARVIAIDPLPEPQLRRLAERSPKLELIEQLSTDAIPSLPPLDAYVIDGDHNYYTVSEELRAIERVCEKTTFPLVMFHDVCWPHARRDSYYAPERIPAEHRQPLAHDVCLVPWQEPHEPGIGMRYPCVAAHEGGPGNGVLTAIEDFVAERDGLGFARIPAFFGLGVLWAADAEWAGAVARIVEPLHDHPVLERLEGNRVVQLIQRMSYADQASALADRIGSVEEELRPLLDSRAMVVAEKLSDLKARGGRSPVSRERLRQALNGG
jgi:SAM-dependent methyltransferase